MRHPQRYQATLHLLLYSLGSLLSHLRQHVGLSLRLLHGGSSLSLQLSQRLVAILNVRELATQVLLQGYQLVHALHLIFLL